MKAQLCPKCNGQGVVSRPPWVPADVITWSSTQATFQCDVCNGAKILYVPDDATNICSTCIAQVKKMAQIKRRKEMTCNKCGTKNAPLKKCCSSCGAFLEGRAINNVTGEVGYRNADGSFTPDSAKNTESDHIRETTKKEEV